MVTELQGVSCALRILTLALAVLTGYMLGHRPSPPTQPTYITYIEAAPPHVLTRGELPRARAVRAYVVADSVRREIERRGR